MNFAPSDFYIALMPARLDKWPRIVSKKPLPVVLDDDAEARLQMSETQYRRELFRSFVAFCRDAGAWVVSAPFERQCRVDTIKAMRVEFGYSSCRISIIHRIALA